MAFMFLVLFLFFHDCYLVLSLSLPSRIVRRDDWDDWDEEGGDTGGLDDLASDFQQFLCDMLFPGVATAAVSARIPSAAAWAVLNASALAASASVTAADAAADGASDMDMFAADGAASVSAHLHSRSHAREQVGPVLAHAAAFWASLRFGPRATAPFVDQFRRVPPELQAVLLWLLAFQRKSGGGKAA
jgi:hypothetical protein